MEQRLSMVTLAVPDLAAARAFFETGLGWTAGEAPSDKIVFFQTGGSIFALYERSALEDELGRSVPAETLGGVALAWNGRSKEEVDEVFERALKAGAKPVKHPVKAFWGGYSSYIELPGGHLMEIAYNPFWPIAEDGSVRLAADASEK